MPQTRRGMEFPVRRSLLCVRSTEMSAGRATGVAQSAVRNACMRCTHPTRSMRSSGNPCPNLRLFEFKQNHELQSREQKGELLKDLTGMANGGGGSVLYGIAEDEDGMNTAANLVPLNDSDFPGRIEDIVRSGVQPPLLYRLQRIDVVGGFVLEVDVVPSTLGPYMVTRYPKTESRYFKRHGIRTDAMSEQEVRDAYSLALRVVDRRPLVWAAHSLPLRTVDDRPRVDVAAVPIEPFREVIDLRNIGLSDVQPPAGLSAFINRACDAAVALGSAVSWADGIAGMHSDASVRLHKDGSAGISQDLPESQPPLSVARVADAMLAYLGWVWEKFDLRRPVELKLSVAGLRRLILTDNNLQHGLAVIQPPGVDVDSVRFELEIEPWDVATPSIRHKVVQNLTDCLVQAYGRSRAEVPFTMGHLFGADSRPLSMTLQPPIASIYCHQSRSGLGVLTASGLVKSGTSGRPVAFVDGGVILDLAGDTLAVVELGTGSGYPKGYFPPQMASTELEESTVTQAAPEPTDDIVDPPLPTARWSQHSLREVLQDAAGL